MYIYFINSNEKCKFHYCLWNLCDFEKYLSSITKMTLLTMIFYLIEQQSSSLIFNKLLFQLR